MINSWNSGFIKGKTIGPSKRKDGQIYFIEKYLKLENISKRQEFKQNETEFIITVFFYKRYFNIQSYSSYIVYTVQFTPILCNVGNTQTPKVDNILGLILKAWVPFLKIENYLKWYALHEK